MQICHYTNPAGELRVACEYSDATIAVWRSLGGRFDGSNREWTFPGSNASRVLREVERLFGLAEAEPVIARVRSAQMASGDGSFRGWADGPQVTVGGYVLACRRDRDRLAEIKAPLDEGLVPRTGGSVKRPAVNPSADAVFVVEVRRDFAESNGLEFDPLVPPGPVATRVEASSADVGTKGGSYLLRLDLPSGGEMRLVDAVKDAVRQMTEADLVERLRPAP